MDLLALPWLPLILLASAVALGAFMQGATGIGFALVVPACALVLAPGEVIGTVARLAVLVDLALVARHRHHVDLRAVRDYLGPAVAVVPIAVLATTVLPAEALVAGAAGVTLLAMAGLALGGQASATATATPAGSPVLAGAASGFLGVTAGLSGPPVALHALRRRMPAVRSRATLAAFFLPVDLLAVGVNRRAAGVVVTVLLGVGAVAGLAAGSRAAGRLPEGVLRQAMVGVVGVSALAAITRQVL